MRRTLFTAMLTAMLAGCGSTATTDGDLASFCHGYIQKGLGEYPVEGVDRNAMWLSWNEVIPVTLFEGQKNEPSYQQGRDTFGEQLAANNVSAMQDVVEDDCDQGYNPLWRWW
jgi:hypothetical protein